MSLSLGAGNGVHLRELLDRGGSKRLSTGQEVTVLTGGAVLVVASIKKARTALP